MIDAIRFMIKPKTIPTRAEVLDAIEENKKLTERLHELDNEINTQLEIVKNNMTLEEMKQRFIDGSLLPGIYTSGLDKIIEVSGDGIYIKTYQDNGWTRINGYTYDGDVWTYEEFYDR